MKARRFKSGGFFVFQDGTMELRIMTLEDYDSVYGLWLSCKGMGLNNLDDSREGIGRFLERQKNRSET